MQEMNNNLNVQEMIKDKILNGGRFGGNAARRMVYQLNKNEFNKIINFIKFSLNTKDKSVKLPKINLILEESNGNNR